jgi:hypothetical protein
MDGPYVYWVWSTEGNSSVVCGHVPCNLFNQQQLDRIESQNVIAHDESDPLIALLVAYAQTLEGGRALDDIPPALAKRVGKCVSRSKLRKLRSLFDGIGGAVRPNDDVAYVLVTCACTPVPAGEARPLALTLLPSHKQKRFAYTVVNIVPAESHAAVLPIDVFTESDRKELAEYQGGIIDSQNVNSSAAHAVNAWGNAMQLAYPGAANTTEDASSRARALVDAIGFEACRRFWRVNGGRIEGLPISHVLYVH